MPRLKLNRPPEWGASPVPREARTLGALDLAVLWSSLGVGLLVLAAGALLITAFGLTMGEVLVVSVVGSIIGSVMLAAAARTGTIHGVPTMVGLRPVLGRKGSWAPSALNAFQLLGWAAFELLVMGIAGAALTHDFAGPLTAVMLIPVAGAMVLALAWMGPLRVIRAWMERFSFWIMIGTSALIAYALLNGGRDLSGRAAPGLFMGWPSYLLALDLVIVMPISWWPLVADYNRFALSPRASTVGTVAGYASANTAFYALGAALGLFAFMDPNVANASGSPFGALAQLALGSVALLVILGDETDNAFANVYSTAVSVQNVAPRLKQFPLVLAATAIAVAGALWLAAAGEGLGGAFEIFLLVIGGMFVPLLGVVIADAFVLRKAGYRTDEFALAAPAVRRPALVAWVCGALLYVWASGTLPLLFGSSVAWIPAFPLIGATLPSFGAAALLHIVLTRATTPKNPAVSPPGETAA